VDDLLSCSSINAEHKTALSSIEVKLLPQDRHIMNESRSHASARNCCKRQRTQDLHFSQQVCTPFIPSISCQFIFMLSRDR